MTRRTSLFRWDELPLDKITEMVAHKVIAGDDATLTQAYYKKGTIVPLHAHPSDVILYVLQGAMRVSLDGEDVTVREGDVLVVPAETRHQAESLDDTFVLTASNRSASS